MRRFGGDSYRPEEDRRDGRDEFLFRAPVRFDTRDGNDRSDPGRGGDSYKPDRQQTPYLSAPSGPKYPVRRQKQNKRQPTQQGAQNRGSRNQNGRNGNLPARPPPQQSRPYARSSHHNPLAGLERERTPEFFAADLSTAGQNRFKAVSELSEDSAAMELDSDVEESQERPSKRVALEKEVLNPDEAPAIPKWSNPDVYTALTGEQVTAQSSRKGMNLINVIRKARNDIRKTQEASSITTNQDFLSLDMQPTISSPLHTTIDLTGDSPAKSRKAGQAVNAPKAKNILLDDEDEVTESALGSRKRTHDDDIKVPPSKKMRPSRELDQVAPHWRPKRGLDATPWFTPSTTSTSNKATETLSKEIIDFHSLVKPRDFEEGIRRNLISRIEREVTRQWQGSRLHAFGSFGAGLYLPTADMDLVLMSPQFMRQRRPYLCQKSKDIHSFSHQVLRSGIPAAGSMQVIAKAKVPIIKFVDSVTGLNCDMSFDNDSGTNVLEIYQKWADQYPAMPIIAAVIKQFLVMRDLNDVAFGGLGGYSVICLVVSFLQHSPPEKAQDYGELLLGFFDFWGNKFDLAESYVSLEPPGYFPKKGNSYVLYNPNRNSRLCVMDPSRIGNDISGGTRKISEIFKAFSSAHAKLIGICSKLDPTESILSCVIGGDYSSYEIQRAHLQHVWDETNGTSQYSGRGGAPGKGRGTQLLDQDDKAQGRRAERVNPRRIQGSHIRLATPPPPPPPDVALPPPPPS